MQESEIQQLIQLDARSIDCHLMRNNSGALEDKTGRLVRFGLNNISQSVNDSIKSSDLIGFTRVLITPEHVGQVLAVFTAIEVKREDWKPSPVDKRERAQFAFLQWVNSFGGIAGFANSVAAFRRVMGK